MLGFSVGQRNFGDPSRMITKTNMKSRVVWLAFKHTHSRRCDESFRAMLRYLIFPCQVRSICALFVGLLLPSVALGAIHWPASC